MASTMIKEAIVEYHSLLLKDETLTAELFARLKERMEGSLLTYGAHALGVSLRPHLLSRHQYDALARKAEAVACALDMLVPVITKNPAMMDRIGLHDKERELAVAHPGFRYPTVTARLDAFVHADEIKFVEYNAENPSSLTDQAGLNSVLFEMRAMQALAERYRLRQFDPAEAMLRALLGAYEDWGGKDVPNVAIVDWADLPTASEFVLLRNYFVGQGVPTIICTPDELEYEGGVLRRGDFRIDLVYKRVIIHEYLARYDLTHALARAYLNRHVCVVNPFCCKMLHKKACFELLTDEANQIQFSEDMKEAIHDCVPWTRRVAERRTTYHGQEVDLLEYLRRNRQEFILKPNDDYGGHGLFLGHQSTAGQWDDALSTALKADYIVQELVELHMEEFPIFDEERWSLQPMYIDTNPFIFRRRVEGALVRLSDSPVVNVTSGGGETGFFVIEGRV